MNALALFRRRIDQTAPSVIDLVRQRRAILLSVDVAALAFGVRLTIAGCHATGVGSWRGNFTVNREPLPITLSTRIRP